MGKVYNRIESIVGNVITVNADGKLSTIVEKIFKDGAQ